MIEQMPRLHSCKSGQEGGLPEIQQNGGPFGIPVEKQMKENYWEKDVEGLKDYMKAQQWNINGKLWWKNTT